MISSFRRYPAGCARPHAPIRGLSLAATALLAAGFHPALAQQGGAAAGSRVGSQAGSGASGMSAEGARAAREKGSYSLGVLLGFELRQLGIPAGSVAFDKMDQGLRDVVKGTAVPSQADRQNVQQLLRLVMQDRAAAAGKNESAARKFLAENAKRDGIVTTASGLQYRVLAAGSGASPRPIDQVTVNYRGTLLDGTEFDSSYRRGKPAQFQVNGVIKGWQEALALMRPGAKWELYIPPELAYGSNSPPQIPPGSLLKFEVELLSVIPASAPRAGGPPSAGGGTSP